MVLVAFIVVNVFGIILLAPTQAYAQWVVTDPITGANTTIRNITDFIRVVLIGVMGTALLNGVWYFAQRIAYDSAVWLASGGTGQDALVFQDGFKKYLENTSLDAVGEVIGSIDLPGFDLCRPPSLSSIMGIQLGIAQRFQRPTPRCSWNDLSSNWDAFLSSATGDEVLGGLSNLFRPGQSGLEVAFTLGSRSHELSLRREMEAREDRKEGNGFRPVTDAISGRITTPAQAVRQKSEELVANEKEARDQTLGQAGSALAAGAFQLLPATLTIFTNTLMSSLTQKIFTGLFSPGPVEERGPLFNPEASSRSVAGRARAQAVFADLLTPKFVEVQNYDALTEFMTCPGKNRGQSNCVIDAAFASIVRISESGMPVTVSDAMKQGALHPDWVLVPSTDAGNNQDPNCYTRAYCYSNLAKLRRARIIPIGWELAAEQGARLGIKPTLQEVVSHFYDCDPQTGGISDAYPWCHLIDPNWVLKYPPTQCKSLVKGPTLLAAESSVRGDTCVDAASCIATDGKGNCTAYGYCTKENNVWQMPGESCPAKYESCESYRQVGVGGKLEKESFLLTNTVDFDGCTAEVAGCGFYSNARTPGGTAETGWQIDSRVYFNRNVEECKASDDGCADLILKGAGVSKNLIRNSSFEIGNQADGAINFWKGDSGAQNYSSDGLQSYRGNAAARVGDSGAFFGPSDDIFLEPETSYVLSYHAKQSISGGAVPVNARFRLQANGAGLDMTGRTNCAFAGINGELDTTRMLLRFIPGDAYSRTSCVFTTPAGDTRPNLSLIIYGDEAEAVWVDAVQLEEGVSATEYRENGYPTNATHVSYKAPPAYLGCTGGADDPAECKNYALICAPEDANCELYTPSDGSPRVPGIATTDNICPAECVGYSTFRQEPTRFEGPLYPLFFIPKTGDKCAAQYAGCDQFTNLETSATEHYTYLRQCVRPGANTAAYYTWEGSDTTGFQLKVWNLLSSDPQVGEAGRPPAYRQGYTDYGSCTRDVFQAGFNSDCREFYDERGNISYRLYSETVVATAECNRYRRTEASVGEEDCRRYGGEWDAGLSSCTYLGYPKESLACPAEANLCRAYTGNAGRNFRIIKEARFERGDNEGLEGIISSESIFVGGHSLQVLQIPNMQNGGSTRFDVGRGETVVRTGGTYVLTFIAKGSGRPIIRFSGDEGNTAKYFVNGTFDLRSDWQKYTVGPVLIERPVAEDEYMNITNLDNPTFIDDLELREVSENIYLVKNSWNTPASCDLASDGETPFPQAMLGCSEYKDTKNISVNLTGFDRLCREEAVGCRAVIDTHNSESLEEERYNLACVLPAACAETSCACSATVNGEVRQVCEVNRGEASCRFNSIGEPAGAEVGGVNYLVEVGPDSVIVPSDETKYLVLSSEQACRAEAVGCTLYGRPSTGVCALPNACAAAAGCDCLINNDLVCKVTNGATSCNYQMPRYYLDGDGANWSPITLKNDPAKYGSTLCTAEFLGCSEWQKGSKGPAYFKDPVEQVCEYRENVARGGVTTNGWFKKGMNAEPCDPAFAVGGTEYNIRKNGDAQYLGWAGVCNRENVGCTAFLDPADKSSSYPEGKPYYVIKDERLNEGNDCNGRASQKEGCVLFKDTSIPLNQYSSAATYALSANQNYGLVPVSTCPDGVGCKRCDYVYWDNIASERGGDPWRHYSGEACIQEKDCGPDIQRLPYLDFNEVRCIEDADGRKTGNNSNVLFKVVRDRQCSEWLDCKTSVTVWDDGLKKFKKVCTQLGRCDAYVTTSDGIKCANYKSADYSGDVLTLSKYVDRDVSWYGKEYSGYSIPGHYPTEELHPVDYDKTVGQDMRLAYVACEEIGGADRNCDRREDAPEGACRRVGATCGESNAKGARGMCVTSGVAGAAPLCVYGIDGGSVTVQNENQRLAEVRMPINRSLPKEQCRAYPEQDSPFPANVSEWTQNGMPLGRILGFQQANVCEKFAWRDIDGDGIRDTTPAWPDPRAELIPQNCECSYSKAVYNGKSFTKYFGIEGDIMPAGICQGGPRSGESCVPEASYNDKKDSRDPQNLKTCGPQTQGGLCQKIERVDKVVGQFGQCLEYDYSLSLNGVQSNYACLTWNPLDIIPGGRDIYNQFASAGYSPSGSTGKYYCLEGEGNGDVNAETSENEYNLPVYGAHGFSAQAAGGGNDFVYQEKFYTLRDMHYVLGPRSANLSQGGKNVDQKDIAAFDLNFNVDQAPDALKSAIANAEATGLDILARTNKTGRTPNGKYFWETTIIPAGQLPSRSFTQERLIDAGVNTSEFNGFDQDDEFTGFDQDGNGIVRDSENDILTANNDCSGPYLAVRALFENTPKRRLLGLWTSACSYNDAPLTLIFKFNLYFAEPCKTIAKVEGSNAAFTDRTWPASGYTVSDINAALGQQSANFKMLGYGYDQRNAPFGSAAITQEPFGIELWQINGPDGFGSPYTKYIPDAPDAGSPYGCSGLKGTCGFLKRCTAAIGNPFTNTAAVSLNTGGQCQANSGCPIQAVCGDDPARACSPDQENSCPGSFCSAKHCTAEENGSDSPPTYFPCQNNDDCTAEARGAPRGQADWFCADESASTSCVDSQFVSYPANDQLKSPLEFLFAKTFGIWKWSANAGMVNYGVCTGNTPEAGNACSNPDNSECSDNDGTCNEIIVCNQGPQKGNSCGGGNQAQQDARCNGGLPNSRAICTRGTDEFAELVCPPGSDNAGVACDEDRDCYDDTAICNLNLANPVCAGGVFEDPTITDIGSCPDGWRKENGKCKLPCASNTDCRWSGATCGGVGVCSVDSGKFVGVSCAITGNAGRDNSACRYGGVCQITTTEQTAGYQKLQSTPENQVGWDNRQGATLGEQPHPPMIASPDISSCDPQSQRCRVSGVMPGLSNINCSVNRDCPTGWTCSPRIVFGINADTDDSTCMPPLTLDLNALSINNRTSGDLRGAGSYRAVLRFYAWADHNTMPIASRSVNWGDGIVERTADSRYKNHKPICSASDADAGAVKECAGMPGLTCAKQGDCPVGTGLCSPIGRCSSSRTRCSVDEDCPLSSSGVERCVLSRFGNSADACNEEYFEFEHTYVCTKDFMATLPNCTGKELDPNNRNPNFAGCKRDVNGDSRADVCVFRPKVQVKDNWGFCNGVCPSNARFDASPGGLRCFENECEVHSGAWTGFGGFITVAPRN